MKKILCTLFFLFNLFSFSQEQKDFLPKDIEQFVRKKTRDYYSLVNFFAEKPELSYIQINELLKVCKQINYAMGECHAYNLYGLYLRHKNEYLKSIEKHQRALKIAKKIKNQEAKVVTFNMIAVSYRRQQIIQTAIDYYQKAYDEAIMIHPKSKDLKISLSIAQNGIGNIYVVLRQYNLAIKKFREALKYQYEVNDRKGIAINQQNMGYSNEKLGRLNEAMRFYRISLSLNREIKNMVGVVVCQNSISRVLMSRAKYQEALGVVEPNLNLAISLEANYYLSQTYNTLAKAQIYNGLYENAKKNLEKALSVAKKNKSIKNVIESLDALSMLYDRKGDFKKALYFYKKSKDIEEQSFNDRSALYINKLIENYDIRSKNNEIERLRKENEIAKYKASRNQNILIIVVITLTLLSVVLYSIYRQNELKNEQKILTLKQDALQSQMNPHFIFNALNSIKLYIINNEKKNAVYYLNKFSKLIRNILEASKIKETSLKEEIKTMQLYTSIENIRFSNEIEYTEYIEEALNLETIKIPPLILQPFLENAIWHGLSSKTGKKSINLSVKKIEQDMIQIEIIDNGIGREAAFKIKKAKTLNRKSIGIDLTKQRLKSFVSTLEKDYTLKYFDLKDNDGNILGTKVRLCIPLY